MLISFVYIFNVNLYNFRKNFCFSNYISTKWNSHIFISVLYGLKFLWLFHFLKCSVIVCSTNLFPSVAKEKAMLNDLYCPGARDRMIISVSKLVKY
jgi:hypothetical protein